MSNEFRGVGNAGTDAVLTTVLVDNVEKRIAELSVYFDGYRPASGDAAANESGFWLNVTVWGERHAAEVAQHVKKGARIQVMGRLTQTRWTVTATGEERRALHLDADRVFLALTRVAEVRFHPSRSRVDETG